MSRLPLAVGSMLLVVVAPARAQHAPQLADRACDLCHASHETTPGPYNLKAADLQVWGPRGGDLGVASRSCMRCHAQAGIRARQPDVSASVVAGLTRGAYLGYDLSDDHPVGATVLGFSRRAEPGIGPSALRGSAVAGGRRLTPAGRREAEQQGIECSRCHDPHDQQGPLLGPEREAALCASCHNMVGGAAQQHAGVACSGCHRLHGGEPGTLLRAQGGDVACAMCHDRGAAPASAPRVRTGVQLAPGHRPGDPRARSGRCTDCHTVHK
ncbi:MAG: cytochrome c3 family protein [Gemmatimonadota bacterium]|nr:cytochrome c3 family protein [Gemmatimonadota bacterium]MDH4351609.1 cytochrome c3 family protein [Gemmatimonadota bacterium]MDH5196634.1 cytochrome c3 family protein [Gemmatimonadota bacterium]